MEISYLERTDKKIQTNEGHWLDQINTLLKMTRTQNSLKNKLSINIECSYTNLFTILLATGCKYLTIKDYHKLLKSFMIKTNPMELEICFKDIDLDRDGLIYSNDFNNFLKVGNEYLQSNITNRNFTKLDQISNVTLGIFKNILEISCVISILTDKLKHERGVKRLFIDSKTTYIGKPNYVTVRDCLRAKGIGISSVEAKNMTQN